VYTVYSVHAQKTLNIIIFIYFIFFILTQPATFFLFILYNRVLCNARFYMYIIYIYYSSRTSSRSAGVLARWGRRTDTPADFTFYIPKFALPLVRNPPPRTRHHSHRDLKSKNPPIPCILYIILYYITCSWF